jgi:hypothetical protein
MRRPHYTHLKTVEHRNGVRKHTRMNCFCRKGINAQNLFSFESIHLEAKYANRPVSFCEVSQSLKCPEMAGSLNVNPNMRIQSILLKKSREETLVALSEVADGCEVRRENVSFWCRTPCFSSCNNKHQNIVKMEDCFETERPMMMEWISCELEFASLA